MMITLESTHIITGIFLAIIFFSLMVIRRRSTRVYPNIGRSQNRLVRLVEALIWPAILFWCVHLIFHNKYSIVVYGVMGIMIIPLCWFIMGDILAGIILKLGENIQPGDHIRTDDGMAGQIVKTGLRSLHLKKDDTTTIIIPYSAISRKTLTKFRASETMIPHIFKIQVGRNQDPQYYKDRIRESTLRNVWSVVNSDPQVQFLEETEERMSFQVTAYPVSPEYGIRIESALKKEFLTMNG